MKKLLFAMAIGAALAWAFDPDVGSRRRDGIRRRIDTFGTRPDAAAAPIVPRSAPTTPSGFDVATPIANVR